MTNPSFLATPVAVGPDDFLQGGLTIREHFAGLAMQGILSSINDKQPVNAPAVALEAVQCADALIQMLNFKS